MSAPAYQPIACADHERLEFAALTRQWLELTVDGVVQSLLPLDVYTRDGEEWLRAQYATGDIRVIRLDRLQF
ncbi:MAG: transcriptional antiterminator, Rof [Hydrogenophilales bacterium 16-64-46]|nr:MAG: transcriptional antiterminator, Rof [Hydrogenophilales bacterium 12-64-13]OYZ04268.1 MAG: transcriptional antiterminator, Rof [Hydrogenophilales bacterium 16-64-46]OZA38524.1 MAG: transcriptional antiterminator, Rof [Hydrogenophilales bacterium 17-64-34]HQT00177.1 transcriptional antiterminator, Rof [Thiobacillus sp.]